MCFESLEPESTARSYGWVEIEGLDLDPPRPLSVRASLRGIQGSYTVLPNATLEKVVGEHVDMSMLLVRCIRTMAVGINSHH